MAIAVFSFLEKVVAVIGGQDSGYLGFDLVYLLLFEWLRWI